MTPKGDESPGSHVGAPPPALPRSAAGPYNPWMIAAMLSLAPFMEVLDSTIANVSLTHIAGSLGASQSESTWILTSYLVANSIVLPISGWLAQVLGRKTFYLISVLLFTMASVLCASATSLEVMIVARILQGIGGGGLAPVAQSMLADSFPVERRPQVFALFAVTIIVAPAVGPVLGGWITDNLSWHWIFLINLPVGLVAFTISWIFLTEAPLLIKERRDLLARGLDLDFFGLFLVATGFGALQIFLDKFELDDGFSSPLIIALCAYAVTSLSLLILWEWQHPQPVMNFRLFKIRNFAICTAVMTFIGFLFLSSTQLLPQLTQSLLGYDSQTSGECLAFGALGTMMVLPIAGSLTGRFVQPRFMMAFALIEIGCAMLLAAHLSPDISYGKLALMRVTQVAFVPFIFIPVSASSYIGVPPRNNGEATALLNQMRNIGGSIGISFATTLLAWREQFHHARLAESITPYGSLHGLTLAQAAAIVQQQARFMSYLDVFWAIGVFALCVWPIVLFLKPPVRRAA